MTIFCQNRRVHAFHTLTPRYLMLNKPKFVLGLGNDKQSSDASLVLYECNMNLIH